MDAFDFSLKRLTKIVLGFDGATPERASAAAAAFLKENPNIAVNVPLSDFEREFNYQLVLKLHRHFGQTSKVAA